MELQNILDRLWAQYVKENPLSLEIHTLFETRGENVVNDHIAFRTFDDPRINLEHLAKFFKNMGYEECGTYDFPVKKLHAKHYEHSTDENQPKIFISELKTAEFSDY